MEDKKYTHEEILNALTVIKEVCAYHNCSDCPFYRTGKCGILQTDLCEWNINLPDSPWRAFN